MVTRHPIKIDNTCLHVAACNEGEMRWKWSYVQLNTQPLDKLK